MRITQRLIALTSLSGMNRNLESLGKLQQQLTSGRLISAPSDSPTGTQQSMRIRAEQTAVAQQSRNITDATSWLDSTDSALQEMVLTTRRVRDITVQSMNTGSLSAGDRAALAVEARSLREGLLALANSTSQGRPIFGGLTAGPKAYVDGSYVGSAAPNIEVTRVVGDSQTLRVNVTGPEAFGAEPEDLFTVVQRIADHMVADPTALSTDLADLDVVMNTMIGTVADIGSRGARLERIQQVTADRQLMLSSQLAETENIDLPSTIMNLEMQKVGYQAALAATAKVLQPTLLDFLR